MMKIFSALMLLSATLMLSACAVSAEYPKDQRPRHVIAGSTLSSKSDKDSPAPAPDMDEADEICTSEENCTCSRM
jgi:hypothetical protein